MTSSAHNSSECASSAFRGCARLLGLAILVLGSAVCRSVWADVEARCALLPTKTSVVTYEPLVLDLRLANVGSNDIYIDAHASLETGSISVTYKKPNGVRGLYLVAPRIDTNELPRTVVAAGGSYYCRLFLLHTSGIGRDIPEEYLFAKAGVYRLWANINVYDRPQDGTRASVESSPICVTVSRGTSSPNTYARWLRYQSEAIFRRSRLPAVPFPLESIHAQYLAYRELALFLREHPPPSSEPVNTLESRAVLLARRGLERMLSEHPNFPALDEVMLCLAQHYERVGMGDRADQLFAEIQKRFPDGSVAVLLRSGRPVRPLAVRGVADAD